MPRPETIFALATPAHPSPVALVRVSGPLVAEITRVLCGAELPEHISLILISRALPNSVQQCNHNTGTYRLR